MRAQEVRLKVGAVLVALMDCLTGNFSDDGRMWKQAIKVVVYYAY